MFQANKFKLIAVSFLALLLVAVLGACSISTQKESNGEDKKVDIKTPFADIHVGSDTSAQDAGISLYPGAKPEVQANDKNRANIQIGGENFGLKVIVAKYVTDDPPQKVIDFYRKDLKQYGTVLECAKGVKEDHNKDSQQISCDQSGSTEPGKMDLAVGVPDRQHIVSIRANGKGTEFSTVFVQLKGDSGGQTM